MTTRLLYDNDPPAGAPPEPTAAQLRQRVAALEAQLAETVPAAEAEKLKRELADAKAELAKAKTVPPAPKRGFFPRLF